MERPSWAPEGIDVEVPSTARIYDYHLGGVHNFPVDREVAEDIARVSPDFPLTVRANRAFLGRSIRYLVNAGIRQFLDLGSGIPSEVNVHEIAHQAAPDSRVVYVDSDAVAVAHSRAMLADNQSAGAVRSDLRDVARVLRTPEVSRLIDFTQPVAVLMVAVLHFIPDTDDLDGILTGYREALGRGSYLVLSHGACDPEFAKEGADEGTAVYSRRVADFTLRDKAQVTSMFAGLELVDPGVVPVNRWRPDNGEVSRDLALWVGVARKS